MVPYAFRLLDYVAKRDTNSNDDGKCECARDDGGQVQNFGFGCLWLHGISIPLCHVHKGISEPSTKNKPTIFHRLPVIGMVTFSHISLKMQLTALRLQERQPWWQPVVVCCLLIMQQKFDMKKPAGFPTGWILRSGSYPVSLTINKSSMMA